MLNEVTFAVFCGVAIWGLVGMFLLSKKIDDLALEVQALRIEHLRRFEMEQAGQEYRPLFLEGRELEMDEETLDKLLGNWARKLEGGSL